MFTQPLVLEGDFRIEGEGEESKLTSNLFIFYNLIFEGRNTSPPFVHVVFHVLVLLLMYVLVNRLFFYIITVYYPVRNNIYYQTVGKPLVNNLAFL